MNFLKIRKRSHCDFGFSEDFNTRNIKRKIVVLSSENKKKNVPLNGQIFDSSGHQNQNRMVNSILRSKRLKRTVTPGLLFNGCFDKEKPRQKRKANLDDAEVQKLNCIHPAKKPRLELVKLFDQQITRQTLNDEVFKFVRLCRYESDLNSPTFFEKLEI